jgi:hypothetical protein
MSAEECGAQVVEALLANEYEPVISIEQATQAMRIKQQDPAAFTQRMAALMKWMER